MKRLQRAARFVGGCAASLIVAGCAQPLMIEPADRERAVAAGLDAGLERKLENQPYDPIAPSLVPNGVSPATILDPSRPARNITLKECIAIAVEQGNVGIQGGVQNAGNLQDTPFNFGGRTLGGTDTIRALVLDPAVVGADIEKALSKFDARWINSIAWNQQDQAVLNLQQSFSNGDSATFNSTLAKPLPTGGMAGISFNVNYQKLSNAPTNNQFVTLNTSYTPRVQFIFEQPLLQNFGVEINQLLPQHAGSSLLSGLRPSGGTTVEGILLTRIRYDQTRADFDRLVNQMLLNVEFAYWNLYAAYYNLFAQEDTLKQAFELYTILKKRYEVGSARRQEFKQTEAQYWLFRQQALTARQQVLASERVLRGLLGMNSFDDGQRLVPVDEPILAPYSPDYYEIANEALAYRPELLLGRMDLKFRQLDLILSKNQRRPDLRSFAAYDINGLGQRLDGSDTAQRNLNGVTSTVPNNALESLSSNQFNSWQLGLRFDMPLGFRDANALVRQSRLNIMRAYYQLQDGERKILETLTNQYREVFFQQQNMQELRQRRESLQETLKLQRQFIEAGSWDVNSLFNVLQTQRDTAVAIATEFQSIAQYNQALSGLEFSKGTIQRYNNISVSDAPLPPLAAKKAADHFRERQLSPKLREREANNDLPNLPSLSQPWESPVNTLPALPAGMNPAPQMPPLPKDMPAPPDAATPKRSVMRSVVEPATPTGVQPWPATMPTGTTMPAAPDEATFKPVGTAQMRKPVK